MGKVLVVDDDPQVLKLIKLRIEKVFDEVYTTSSPKEAMELAQKVQVVLLDQRMPDMKGTELMERILSKNPDQPVIIMTAFGSVEEAVESIKRGAYHYVTKPVNFEELINILKKAIQTVELKEKVRQLEASLCEELIAFSPSMKRILQTAKRVATFDTSVLITGESGVGKEVLARFIHKHSRRQGRRFVVVNCTAIPENLLEAELFGYRKGSFSGAYTDKRGIVEEADGGTLLFDEIGDMPLSLQPKLLRLIQEREIKPIGDTRPRKVDVRLIFATHRNLKGLVEQGRFREDLFYRINVIHIHIPPLRERKEDILPLAYFFIRKIASRFGQPPKELSERAKEQLLAYHWPGNVRELENTIERSYILSETHTIENIWFGEDTHVSNSYTPTSIKPFKEAKEEFERNYLRELLKVCKGNISEASRISGKTRAEIYRLLRKYNLR